MHVETYEAAPTSCGTQAELEEIQSAEAQALIEELGLAGQARLLVEKTVREGETVTTTNPYREMTIEEQRVFGAIAPTRTPLAKYDAGPVPLRVLQVAAHAMPFFETLDVWHPESAYDDPVLVGTLKKKHAEFNWHERKLYILARWGVSLLPFEELRTQAGARLETLWRAKIEREMGGLEAFRARLGAEIAGHLAGENAVHPFSLSLS